MPSKSQAQRRLFGMVTAYKEGKLKKASSKIKEVSKNVDAKTALEFARSVTSKPAEPSEPKPKKKAPATNGAARGNIAKSLM